VLKADGFYGRDSHDHRRPLVLAHRGASDMAPENTLAAFQAAIAAGADGFELDVTRCASGEIVVIHDDTLERTTDGTGRVAATPWSALRELDAGSWFAPQYAGERIPMLQEVLDLAADRRENEGGCRVNIEIKGMGLRGDGLEREVAVMVRAHGLEQHVLLSSFNPLALWRARRAAPDLPRGLLYADGLPIYLARAWARPLVAPTALHPHERMVDEGYVRWARRMGYRLNVWTVDDLQAMRQMIALGVDGIITNHPARLRALLTP